MRLDFVLKSLEGKKTYNVYLLSTAEQQAGSSFLFSKPFVNTDRDALKRINAQYLVVNHADETDRPPNDPLFDQNKYRIKEFVRAISNQLEPMQIFDPYRVQPKKRSIDPWDQTAAPHLAAEVFSRRSLGPYLEVYRVKNE